MAVTNGYCTRAEVFARLNIIGGGTADQQAQVDNAINAASRGLDSLCKRKFWLDGSAVAKTFEPQDLYLLDLRKFPYADIGSTSGLVIKTDSGGDGNFETTWQTSDYELLPYNAPYDGPEAKPWNQIRAVGSQTFPLLIATALTRRDRVQITAKWGYPVLPDAVAEASRILANRIFRRKDTPEGIGGVADFGPIRITGEDKDVVNMVRDYRKIPIGSLVA